MSRHPRYLRRSRVLAAVAGVAALSVLWAGTAYARWTSVGTGTSSATANSLGQGSTPTVTSSATVDRQLDLTWTATAMAPGVNATGYEVLRYTAATGTAGQTYVCGSSATVFVAAGCSDTPSTTGT